MTTYKIGVTMEVTYIHVIEANSEEEALEKFEAMEPEQQEMALDEAIHGDTFSTVVQKIGD